MAYRRTPAIQQRIDEQRLALVTAATTLLSERGYAALSITAVAAQAGISVGGVYKHFDSKAQLCVEVFRHQVTREVEAVRQAVDAHTELTDRVAAYVETFAGRAFKAPRLAYALLAEPVDPAVDAERLTFRVAFCEIVATIVDQGVASGELPPQNSQVSAAALVGAVGEALVGPLGVGVSGPDTVEELIAFAHRALGLHPLLAPQAVARPDQEESNAIHA